MTLGEICLAGCCATPTPCTNTISNFTVNLPGDAWFNKTDNLFARTATTSAMKYLGGGLFESPVGASTAGPVFWNSRLQCNIVSETSSQIVFEPVYLYTENLTDGRIAEYENVSGQWYRYRDDFNATCRTFTVTTAAIRRGYWYYSDPHPKITAIGAIWTNGCITATGGNVIAGQPDFIMTDPSTQDFGGISPVIVGNYGPPGPSPSWARYTFNNTCTMASGVSSFGAVGFGFWAVGGLIAGGDNTTGGDPLAPISLAATSTISGIVYDFTMTW